MTMNPAWHFHPSTGGDIERKNLPGCGRIRNRVFGIFRFPVLPQIGKKQPENVTPEIGTIGNDESSL